MLEGSQRSRPLWIWTAYQPIMQSVHLLFNGSQFKLVAMGAGVRAAGHCCPALSESRSEERVRVTWLALVRVDDIILLSSALERASG
jgi:hypothetical protein